jgi:hypothetical protein
MNSILLAAADPLATAFNIKELFSSTLNPLQVILTLLIALAIGGFLYFIYKKTFAGVVYSRSFNLSLVLLTMVSALVIMLISSNLTLSLGMVGALSIVRSAPRSRTRSTRSICSGPSARALRSAQDSWTSASSARWSSA